MKSEVLRWLVLTVLLVTGMSVGTMAQEARDLHLSGFINDYTPETVNPVGTWEIRGEWSMLVKGHSNKADFSATLTMVRSDFWVIELGGNPDLPDTRVPHTHHITVHDADVTQIDHGFQISGPATITANGSPAGFSPSQVTIQVTGGTEVPYSNIKVTFDSPASGHFGTYGLDGVVRRGPTGDNQHHLAR